LVANEASVNAEFSNQKTILMTAAEKGYIELVREIINLDANINQTDANGQTALHYAINNKAENADIVNLLIEHKADIHAKKTYDGTTPLILAAEKGHVNITRILVEEQADLLAVDTIQKHTALHIAVNHSYKDIVFTLATEQSYPQLLNLQNKDG